MSTDSILVLLGGIAALVSVAIGGRLLLRNRGEKTVETATVRQSGSTATREQSPGENNASGTAKRDQRIDRVVGAYADGEIDERMLSTAARTLGISRDEARRRLEGAADARGTAEVGEQEKKRAQAREKNRKKNKQAKRSRQANRR